MLKNVEKTVAFLMFSVPSGAKWQQTWANLVQVCAKWNQLGVNMSQLRANMGHLGANLGQLALSLGFRVLKYNACQQK